MALASHRPESRLFRRAVQHLAELVPMRAGPALQPHLGEVHVDLVGGVHQDAGQRRGERDIPKENAKESRRKWNKTGEHMFET